MSHYNDVTHYGYSSIRGYDKLVAKKDKYKTAMTSCEQRDIKSRQVSSGKSCNLFIIYVLSILRH